MNIFVSNLNFKATDDELNALFAEYGTVTSANVVVNRNTGRSRGYGFVEMANEDEAQKAIEGLNGKEFQGRDITVTVAKSQGGKQSEPEA